MPVATHGKLFAMRNRLTEKKLFPVVSGSSTADK
jgi:hypothetical protein